MLDQFCQQYANLLRSVYERCARSYGVTYEEFAQALYGHIARSAASHSVTLDSLAAQAIGQVNPDDFCLALGCAKAEATAWDAFMQQYRAFMLAAARSYCQSEAEAQELAESAYAELYGLRHSGLEVRDSKFWSYSGRGSLRGWLRAVLYQMAIDRYRERARLVQPESEVEWEGQFPLRLENYSADPFSSLADERYQQAIVAALEQAFTQLASKDRLLLNYYYFDRLKLREIATLFDVHEATVSRSLKRVHKKVRRAVELALRQQYRLSRTEVQACCEQAVRQLDVNLQSFLLAGLTDD